MGRFSYTDADNYGGSGKSNFFTLKNDGDVARVRFMYNSAEDIVGYAVHEVEVDGRKRYVNCLRDYNEPKSKCPICAANGFQKAKLFIPIYDVDNECVCLWERGKNYFQKLSALCARYATGDKPLVSWTFDIERHGKPGDTQTTYEIYAVESDNTTLEDLGEVPNPLGSMILDKSAEDMEYYLENNEFPSNTEVTRRSDREETPSRRTPSRRGEAF